MCSCTVLLKFLSPLSKVDLIFDFVYLKQIPTHEGRTSSSPPDSVPDSVPKPAGREPSEPSCYGAAGTNINTVTSGCRAGIPYQPDIAQIFPGPSSHSSRPCPVVIPFPTVPSHHRVGRTALPPLSATQPQPGSRLFVYLPQGHGRLRPTQNVPTQPKPGAAIEV